jgi:DNA-binding response OmpR family regulator
LTKRSILVVEDEEKIARVLQLELEYEGYNVEKAFDGNEALEKYRSQKWDLILLDVMLPGMSGIELLRKIRNNDPLTPVILLTARGSVADKVSGLDLGANDYVTKPFEMEELLARIRANLRLSLIQNETGESDWIKIGDLKVNENSREVIRGNHTIELTPREFDLLLYLMKNRGQVLQREQILDAVWGYDFYGDTNVVDVYIRYLRRKIDADQQLPVIHTVRGVGYMVKEAK